MSMPPSSADRNLCSANHVQDHVDVMRWSERRRRMMRFPSRRPALAWRGRKGKKGNDMKKLMLATVVGAALLAGATAASAQIYYDDGYSYDRGPFVERGVACR